MSNYKELFIQESKEIINHLNNNLLKLEQNPNDVDSINAIFRDAHTLKGMAATMEFTNTKELCLGIEEIFEDIRKGDSKIHTEIASILFECFDLLEDLISKDDDCEIESVLSSLKSTHSVTTSKNTIKNTTSGENSGDDLIDKIVQQHTENESPKSNSKVNKIDSLFNSEKVSTIRVKMDDLEALVNLTGELMITKMRLEQTFSKNDTESRQVLVTLSRLITDLQSQTMKVRLVPIDQIFNRFPRIVRDLATKLGKQVSVNIDTAGIELDRSVLDAINEPLIHIIRNAVDHGIETTEERIKSDKPATGTITLTSTRIGDRIQIRIEDDGKGLDLNKIIVTAIDKKIITESQARNMTDEEIVKLISVPGLSTSESISDISGRGVGMDVVFNKVESVGGQVSVKTEKGKGTIISIILPLTMSIIAGLVVTIDGEKYVLPLSIIASTLKVHSSDIKTIDGNEVMMYREEIIPIFHISDILDVQINEPETDTKKTIVVVNNGTKLIGLIVDSFERNQEFVIKRLDNLQSFSNSFTNTTILSDGHPALILDPSLLVQ